MSGYRDPKLLAIKLERKNLKPKLHPVESTRPCLHCIPSFVRQQTFRRYYFGAISARRN